MDSVFRDGLFDGQVCIVSGGGSGIGRSVAERLLQLGASVAICGRTQQRLGTSRCGSVRWIMLFAI